MADVRRRRKRLLAAAAAVLPLFALAPTTAAHSAASQDRHCVAHLSQGAARSAVTCYDTFPKAIADATAGRVANAPADAAAAARDSGFARRLNAAADKKGNAQALAAAETVIGIEFEHRDFRGTSLAVVAPHGCESGTVWDFGNLGGTEWNDRFSSFATFSGCRARHWEDAGLEGALRDYLPSTAYIGRAMNDETSSIQWRR
ncbi:hypothetical protein [Bailinhaonella thermotolerans]|nr:hypothetical protein [Bailinhaonella thermotolerans]